MATYSLNSIDEVAFRQLCDDPSAAQLDALGELLAAGEFEEAPVWAAAPSDWIRQHLSTPDWYEGLSEEEMQVWENGIRAMLDQPQFGLKAHGVHCAVSDMFIEMAAKVYKKRGTATVVRQFWPYRFFDNYDLDYMGYSPSCALLTNEQVGRLITEVREYDALLAEYAEDKPDYVERWRDQINADVIEAMPALQEIYEQKRMWYSQFDF